MSILFAILSIILMVLTIGEKEIEAKKQYAWCYAVTLGMVMVALWLR
jgi:hypothetical protein